MNKSIRPARAYPSTVASFSKGMVQDMAKSLQPKDSYFSATNARIVTDAGQSSLALANTLGNTLDVSFPIVSSIFEITKSGSAPVGSWSIVLKVSTSSGPISTTVTGSVGGWEEYFANIKAAFDSPSTLDSFNVKCARSGQTSLKVYKTDGNINNVSVSAYGTVTKVLNRKNNLIPIASCTMRNEIIVMTRESSPTEPDGQIPGQLWKLTYDEISISSPPIKTLLYTGNFGLSTDKPIKRMLGFYENSKIQRVYWVDDYNPLRVLNIADPDCMGVPITQLGIIPEVNMERINLTSIQEGGALKAGVYQLGYRLIRQGAATSFSVLSNRINIVYSSETSGDYWDSTAQDEYNGTTPGTLTGKSLTFELDNIDTKYDKIEFAVFRHENNGSEGFLWGPFPVPTSGYIEKTFAGNETVSSLTIDEYNLLKGVDTFGDIATQDNYLIAAKASGKQYNDLQFDCRAYRFNSSQQTYMPNWDTVDIFNDPITVTQKDAVNPYNTNIDVSPAAADRYVFKADGTTIGGEGQNLSYQIVAYELDAANSDTIGTSYTQWLNKDRITANITADKTYINVGTWFDYKSPYINQTLIGYTRGETYRFGMVLFDKKQRPSFVQWIGDIRFPEFFDSDLIKVYRRDGTTDTVEAGWIASNFNTTAANSMFTLGIEFTIDISSIQDDISGFQIVRVEKKESDRSRLGMGLLYGLYQGTVWTSAGVTETDIIFDNSFRCLAITGNTNLVSFDTPENFFGQRINYQPGDRLFTGILVENANRLEGVDTADPGSVSTDDQTVCVIRSRYVTDTTIESKEILEGAHLPKGQSIDTFAGTVYNYTANKGANPENFNPSMGCDTMFLRLDTNYVGTATQADFPMAVYVRQNLTQYGGADFISRSKNVYISCSSFIPVTDATASSLTFVTFGGDTFVNMFDYAKGTANDILTGSIIYDFRTWRDDGGSFTDLQGGNNTPLYQGMVFPCESSANLDLRQGIHFLGRHEDGAFPNLLFYALDQDEYRAQAVYSANNDITTYIPKPELYDIIETFDNRFYGSEPKINGEEIDSWRTFSIYKDVDGIYGPINWVETINSNVVFFQDKAVGMLSVNPRVASQTTDGQPLEIARGGVLHDYQYVSNSYGAFHRPAKSTSSIYFFDRFSRKIFKLAIGAGLSQLSDLKGMNSFFYNQTGGSIQVMDNPWKAAGISSVFDRRFNELLMTFFNGSIRFTISFSEYTDTFVSFHNFYPEIYITNDSLFLTPYLYDLYRHNLGDYGQFYGTYYPFQLEHICNPYPTETKVFDTMSMHLEVSKLDGGVLKDLNESMSSLRFHTDVQNTDWITPIYNNLLTRNTYRAEREWKHTIPGSAVINENQGIFDAGNLDTAMTFKQRLRDKYLTTNLVFTNADNRRMILHYLKYNFRLSAR